MRLFLTLLLFIPLRCFAPGSPHLFLLQPEETNIYKRLFYAVCEVESKQNITAVNWKELAHGPSQIRPIRIADYDRRTGKNYNVTDCLSYEVSWEVFKHYARGKSFEQAAKNWNGSGDMVKDYWKKVKQLI